MSDLKLFRIQKDGVTELSGSSVAVEKSLQELIERHLDAFLGIRFLATEYPTGKTHGGRIDTLGIDENGCPVIIEYKRAVNENVINQGLFYLDWLLDHKGEFELLIMKALDSKAAENIEWSSPRLLCIAGNFTKYDEHAVQQINRNIELIRYRRYGKGLLVLELVNATSGGGDGNGDGDGNGPRKHKPMSKTVTELTGTLRDRYESLKAFLLALGDDVQVKPLRYYIAFKRLRNFCSVVVHPKARRLHVYVKVDPSSVNLEKGFTTDVRGKGHHGTGDLHIIIASDKHLEKAKALLVQSYEAS